MAKIKLGLIVTDIRGAIGGTIFSRNKGGAYARKNTAPTNPQTPSQGAARSIFGNVSQTWKTLTIAQQNAWNTAAPGFPYTDVLGDVREYSGRSLFMKLNSQIMLVDGAATQLVVPPTPATLDAIFKAQVSASAATMTVTINNGVSLTGSQKVLLFASAPVSPGVRATSSAGTYRQIGAFAQVAGVVDAFTAYNDVFGAPVVGQRIFIKTKTVLEATGETLEGSTGGTVVA